MYGSQDHNLKNAILSTDLEPLKAVNKEDNTGISGSIEDDERTEEEKDCWHLILNRSLDETMYAITLGSISNEKERELLWNDYLRASDQLEKECWRFINSERQRRGRKWTFNYRNSCGFGSDAIGGKLKV